MSSGPVVAAVVEGERVVEGCRTLMGTTDPTKAAARVDPRRPRPRLGRRGAGEPRARLGLRRSRRGARSRSGSPGSDRPLRAAGRRVPRRGGSGGARVRLDGVRVRSGERSPHARRVALRPARAAARPGEQADPVRRRRAQLHGQGLGRRRRGDRPLGADVPRRLRGRPAQPGRQILYEVLNERDWILAERTYAVWPDMEALMREHGVPQFTVDATGRSRDFDLLGRQLLHRARLHQPAHRPRPGRHPAARGRPRRRRPDRARRRPRGVQPRADRRLPRRRRARRRRGGRARDLRGRPRVEGRGPARAAATSCCCGWPRPAASTCRSSTTSTTCRDGADPARSCPNRPGVPFRVRKHTLMDLDAWPYPKQAAGAAGRDRARAVLASRSSAAAPAAAGSARPA